MNFVLASDDNYVPFLSVTLTSLIENNKSDSESLYIYILNDNISEDNKIHIKSLVKDENVYLEFIKIKKLENMGISLLEMERYSNTVFTAYAYLFMASLLPEEIDKIIYMDCDGLVLGSFEELWNMDLKDNYAAGVLDVIDDIYLEGFVFDLNNYFNAGFLLINLKKWREDGIENSIINFMKNNQYKAYQHDQGIINNVFKDKIAIISPKFNLMEYFTFLDYNLALKLTIRNHDYYNKEIVIDAIDNPVFLHFCGHPLTKPWFNKNHPYKNIYEKYIELAGVGNDKIFKTNPDLTLKSKILYKNIYNPFLKKLLKFCPSSILYKLNKRMILNGIKEDNKKALELAKK